MPSNCVVINGGWREYVVGDSKMDEFLGWLDEFLGWLDENAAWSAGKNPTPDVEPVVEIDEEGDIVPVKPPLPKEALDPEGSFVVPPCPLGEIRPTEGETIEKVVPVESGPSDFSRARFQKLAVEARAAAGYAVGDSWVRAYRALCEAADRLDAMCARDDQQEAQELVKTPKE